MDTEIKNILKEVTERLIKEYKPEKIILFGSKVRGDFDEESDIDILILIDSEVNSKVEEEINEIAYDIELKYEVVFGKIIESKAFWNSPLAMAMPIHRKIDNEGVPL